jgi:hypothetical protein
VPWLGIPSYVPATLDASLGLNICCISYNFLAFFFSSFSVQLASLLYFFLVFNTVPGLFIYHKNEIKIG